MELKFLFGSTHLTPIGKDDTKENASVKEAIIFTRKTDIVQHSDIVKRTSFMGVTNGGFIRRFRRPSGTIWYGESVSCRVSTDESMEKVYHKLVEQNNYWYFEFEMYNEKHAVFMVCPEGFQPCSLISGIEWKPCTHAEAYDIISAEYDCNGW